MLRRLVYPRVEPLLNKAARFCSEKKFTPNQLTLLGTAITFVAGWVYSLGLFALGGILLLLGAVGDLLDGPLARLTGKSTPFGAFLDSTVDRYSDFFIFGGLACYYAGQEMHGSFLVTLGILLGTYATSYTKARAESLIASCPVGIFERAERLLILVLGSFIPVLMPWILGILLVGTNATALQRIFYVKRRLSEKKT